MPKHVSELCLEIHYFILRENVGGNIKQGGCSTTCCFNFSVLMTFQPQLQRKISSSALWERETVWGDRRSSCSQELSYSGFHVALLGQLHSPAHFHVFPPELRQSDPATLRTLWHGYGYTASLRSYYKPINTPPPPPPPPRHLSHL